MKKTIYLLLAIASLCVSSVSAQLISVVSPAGATSLHTDLKAAIDAAENGSFVYISGNRQGFAVSRDNKITKKVHIVGVGYREDLNTVSGPTILRGDICFVTGADGSTITGCEITGNIYIGDVGLGSIGNVVNNLFVHRCRFANIIQVYDSKSEIGGTGIRIAENIIGRAIDLWTRNPEILNNIMIGSGYYLSVKNLKGGVFKNNIYLNGGPEFEYCSNISVVNNIFTSGYIVSSLYPSSFIEFTNNIICTTTEIKNNYWNVGKDKIFKLWEGYAGYRHTNNYRLSDNCVGKNGGTDGKDVGIYGGMFPWKDGGIPYNPHINTSEVSGAANPDGTIQLKINASVDGY